MTFSRSIASLACLAALFAPLGVAARTAVQTVPAVSVDSSIFVERGSADSGRLLQPASQLRRGDRVVYVVSWYRLGGAGGFVVTNPLPRTVYYQRSASGTEEVSVDGGRTWGKLGALRVGSRIATAEDVTHVRWRVAPHEAAQGSGRIAYSAIVR